MHNQATFVNTVTVLCSFLAPLLQICEDKLKGRLICFSSVLHCLCFDCAKTVTAESRICCILNVLVWTTINGSEIQKTGCISEGLYNYKLVIMTAWVQLNAPVWVSYKQKQREPIIRCRRLQGRVSVSQPEPVWEVLRLAGEVQREHAAGQELPRSPLFNLITVMSLETVGCTTSNVDADKHAALTLTGSWTQSASAGSNPAIARRLIGHRNRWGNGQQQEAAIWLKVKQVWGAAQRKVKIARNDAS